MNVDCDFIFPDFFFNFKLKIFSRLNFCFLVLSFFAKKKQASNQTAKM